MSNVFYKRMPAGIAGDATRREHATIEPQMMNSAKPVKLYGVPVKMVNGKIEPINHSSDAAASVYGFAVRPFPIQSAGGTGDAKGGGIPPVGLPLDILRRGYMTVKVQKGTPVKNATVYVRKDGGTDDYPVGGLECDSDTSNTIELTSVKFMGEADADGNVEISFNI